MNIGVALILVAFILAFLRAFCLLPHPRVHWGWLAISVWFASMLVGNARLL